MAQQYGLGRGLASLIPPKKNTDGSFAKVVVRKRPGTESICAAIMNKYSVDTVPHLICGGFSVNETEDALINLHYLGIDNVLVLLGDAAKNETAFLPEPGGHKFASDLLKQVVDLNSGIYLEEELKNTSQTKFCIGVAGYPEKHFEAPNMENDLHYLKLKVDMGADYIVTQMFFGIARYTDAEFCFAGIFQVLFQVNTRIKISYLFKQVAGIFMSARLG